MLKNKKNFLAIFLVLAICIIGFTFAYFSDSVDIVNNFSSKPYGTSVVETFVSPDNWLPGDTTGKSLIVNNTGQVDVAVRVSYTEEWVSKNGDTLSNTLNGESVAIIKFINEDDWVKIGNYYYYNHKLESGDHTNSFIESVTFNENVDSSLNCSTVDVVDEQTNEVVGKRSVCSSSNDGYDGATYTLTFNVETIQFNQYSSVWNIDHEIGTPVTASGRLIAKANEDETYEDGNKGEMFKFSHGDTVQVSAMDDYRYIGSSPNNYVKFNCKTLNDEEVCEIWRIIGVFNVEDENDNFHKRIKLIRNRGIGNYYWADNQVAEWTTASLNIYLNGTYYDSLSDSAKDVISTTKYYLGSYNTDERLSAPMYYENERGNMVQQGRSLYSYNKVGLMYPSDDAYIYGKGVNDTCYNNTYICIGDKPYSGWIYISDYNDNESNITYMWTITPYGNGAYLIHNTGKIGIGNAVLGTRPVVYLDEKVKIFDGDGSIDNPYVFYKEQ